MIYAVVGASGSGKSTISEVFDEFNVSRIISHTTRKKRIGERDDEYYFKTLNEFDEIDFIERVEYSGNHYGISKSEVDEKVSNGDCYVIVDRLGVEQLKKIYDNVVVIFIYAPIKDLIHNMEKRGDNKQNILARVNNANNTGELDNFDIADYIIYNNSTIENAKEILRNILKPTIYIDIDNTVHNSTRRFVEVYNEIHNSNKDWTKVTDWSFKPELEVSHSEILNIFETDDFYKGNNLYPSLIQAISTLKEWGCNIKFVTIGTKTNNYNKCRFLEEYFKDIDIISLNKSLISMDKSMIKMKHNDIFIDDHETNLITSNCKKDRRILFCAEGEKSWNRNFRGHKADSWKEVLYIIKNILKEMV